MGKLEIETWANERIKHANGTWAKDTMEGIFYLMENRGPCYWETPSGSELKEEYIKLVELACEYLIQTHDVYSSFRLGTRLRSDFRKLSFECRSELLSSTEKLLQNI